jgi:hypothetical protein
MDFFNWEFTDVPMAGSALGENREANDGNPRGGLLVEGVTADSISSEAR